MKKEILRERAQPKIEVVLTLSPIEVAHVEGALDCYTNLSKRDQADHLLSPSTHDNQLAYDLWEEFYDITKATTPGPHNG